ncbi:hypothetical protein ANN_09647 [Periplaneta americana]|uniref:PiggyBac transposable element-derived protein domain-containing protein n=1 Tax=Periplaneta americana TaxID=6978 RepID=A0ABQ8TLY1_PERAM|nr:hypothetical protein ANN_09647 [Periplaneta americana]
MEMGHLYVRWMDNTIITMISTSCGIEEIMQVKRFRKNKSEMVPRPKLIANYNLYMGNTVKMVQNLSCYRIGI